MERLIRDAGFTPGRRRQDYSLLPGGAEGQGGRGAVELAIA